MLEGKIYEDMIDFIPKIFVQYLVETTIIISVLTFVFIIYRLRKVANELDPLLIFGAAISSALAPSGIALILYSLRPELFESLESLRHLIAISGLILICMPLVVIRRILAEYVKRI